MTESQSEVVPATWKDDSSELLGTLPRELSWLLIATGIGGILLPGPVGTPFLLLGGASLNPRFFTWLENGFRKRCPRCHQRGMTQVRRYLADLEKRYPWTYGHESGRGGA